MSQQWIDGLTFGACLLLLMMGGVLGYWLGKEAGRNEQIRVQSRIRREERKAK